MCGHFAYRSKQRGPYRGCGEEAYRRWMEYNRKKTICGENRNSYSKTDTDATFMHKRAIRGILADYEKEERDIIYLESKNHCVLVHLDGIRQTPEGSPSFYATLDEAEHEFASSAFLRIHKSYLINGDHILQMSNYKVLLDTGMTLKGSRKYFSKAKLEFYRGR